MDRSEKGTAVGATGGAIAGAAIGGPIGAAVGAGVGGYVGHHQGDEVGRRDAYRGDRVAGAARSGDDVYRADSRYDPALVRSVQESLNRRGFDAGPVDGLWGPGTEYALRRFQEANGLTPSGALDSRTMSALAI
jgi:hypothetical protein